MHPVFFSAVYIKLQSKIVTTFELIYYVLTTLFTLEYDDIKEFRSIIFCEAPIKTFVHKKI